MSYNAAAKAHAVQERLAMSRSYILRQGYPDRASSDVRALAMAFALDMASVRTLKEMVPIYIERDMLLLVQHAMKTFPLDTAHQTKSVMFKHGLVYADSPLVILSHQHPILIGQWSSTLARDAVTYVSWHSIEHGLLWPYLAGSMMDGATFSDAENGGDSLALADHVAFASFMQVLWYMMGQRIAVKEQERAPRHMRRHEANVPSEVTVIRLRRPSRDDGTEHTHSPVDWSHRWQVEGHWRKQYHPSTDSREPMWIAPYIKGPADKPLVLKEKIYTFVR